MSAENTIGQRSQYVDFWNTVLVPKFNAWRLTFTFPLINHARQILFLVGASKSPQLIERVLAGDHRFPAARVNPSAGEVTWMIAE